MGCDINQILNFFMGCKVFCNSPCYPLVLGFSKYVFMMSSVYRHQEDEPDLDEYDWNFQNEPRRPNPIQIYDKIHPKLIPVRTVLCIVLGTTLLSVIVGFLLGYYTLPESRRDYHHYYHHKYHEEKWNGKKFLTSDINPEFIQDYVT